ncbi:MAG: T9SS type A sorting domain-containing protein, partial [Bacteroidales bacterium]|nr:T9SS type A sorting domain-containing protein [Bacteroidales bacterium]
DYAMVRVNGEGEMPLNFDAAQDGSFTLSVKVEGMDMGYLHLVDNMTGADVDLLATSTGSEATYTFIAKTTDYASRFRLVFDTNNASVGSTSFAYISNGNIVVTNASANAMLQIVDVMGRVIVSVGGHTRCITTSGIPAGVYVLRLVSGDDVKVQKIIIG